MASTASSTSQLEPSAPSPQATPTQNGHVTEDEAALYDRQIRLWGLAAQTRLRSAHILIAGWNGPATEIIKNAVLSGVGSITILDPTRIDASVDLLSNFFLRDEEEGQLKCSKGPLDRVRALNPNVKVTGVDDEAEYQTLMKGGEEAVEWLTSRGVDVIVAGTPLPPNEAGVISTLTTLNNTTRAAGIKFFLSVTYGFGGLYFADQITHDYILERAVLSTSKDTPGEKQRVKRRQTFIPLSTSLETSWTSLTERQQKRLRVPLDYFLFLALTDLRDRLHPHGSDTSIAPSALKARTSALIKEKGLSPSAVFNNFSKDPTDVDQLFERTVAPGGTGVTLAPVGSVLGGILSQDILNSIGGREEPVVNWLFLSADGLGQASVCRIGELPAAVVVD